MDHVRTYFANRIDAARLSRLLTRREPFYLENVVDVVQTAEDIAGSLRQEKLTLRIHDRRFSLARDMATQLLPWPLLLLACGRQLVREIAARIMHPRPQAIVIMRNGSVQVQYRRKPVA